MKFAEQVENITALKDNVRRLVAENKSLRHPASPRWVKRATEELQGIFSDAPEKFTCTCSSADMPFGSCCKVRSEFEKWYDGNQRELVYRLQPFDVWKAGFIAAQKVGAA